MERKFVTIANFDANDNEISMVFPTLKVTADVSQNEIAQQTEISNFCSLQLLLAHI